MKNSLKVRTPLSMWFKDWRFWFKVLWMLAGVYVICSTVVYQWVVVKDIDYNFTINGDYYGVVNGAITNIGDDKAHALQIPLYGNVLWESKAIDGVNQIVPAINAGGKVEVLSWNIWGYVLYQVSFFTLQSNLLILAWWIYALIFHPFEGKKGFIKANISTAVAVYITITMIIALGYLMPFGAINAATSKGKTNPLTDAIQGYDDHFPKQLGIFNQFFMHLFTPLAFIIYVVFFLKKERIFGKNEFLLKQMLKYALYPICYAIFILISECLLHASHAPYILQAPYFFFYYWQNGGANGLPLLGIPIQGWLWAIITVGVLFAIVIGSGVLYHYIAFQFAMKGNAELKTKWKEIKHSGGKIKQEFINSINEKLAASFK